MKKVLLILTLLLSISAFAQEDIKKDRKFYVSISSNSEVFYNFFRNDVEQIRFKASNIMKAKEFYNIFNWRKDVLFSCYWENFKIFVGFGYEDRFTGIDNTGDVIPEEIASIRYHQKSKTFAYGIGYCKELGKSFLLSGNLSRGLVIPENLESIAYRYPKDRIVGLGSPYHVYEDVEDNHIFYSIENLSNVYYSFNIEFGYRMNKYCNIYLGLDFKYFIPYSDVYPMISRDSHSNNYPLNKDWTSGLPGTGFDYPLGGEYTPSALGLNLKVEIKI